MYKANKNGKRKLIVILSHKIVIDFAIFFNYFHFHLTDYWHDRRVYVNGSFRSGLFRTWSFRPNVLSISFGGSFPPIISPHELSCSQGELMIYPCHGVRPSTIFKYLLATAWSIKAKFYVEPPSEDGTKVYINGPGHIT